MSTTVTTFRGSGASADEDGDATACDADNPPEQASRSGAAGDAAEVEVALAGAAGLDARWLRERLAAAVGEVPRPVRRVTVTVIGDARMRDLNRRHRNADHTTDVLAFELSAPGAPVEADIVVCGDEASRRAAELGHAVERELLLYALHGVLHCAGFDDHTREGFDAMHAEEDRILAAIGVGATFSARDGAARREGRNT